MEKYERTIGLKTIYLTLARRFKYIVLLFIPLALATFVFTNYVMKKTYSSTVTFSKDAAYAEATTYYDMKTFVTNSFQETADKLAADGVKHANGSEITASEISAVTIGKFTTNSRTFTVSFQSQDSSIPKKVLDALATIAVDKCYNTSEDGTKTAKKNFEGTAIVNGEASKATKSSSEKKYLLIGLVASALVACGVPFIIEIVADDLYDKEDIEVYGYEAFEVKVSNI